MKRSRRGRLPGRRGRIIGLVGLDRSHRCPRRNCCEFHSVNIVRRAMRPVHCGAYTITFLSLESLKAGAQLVS